MSWILGHTAIFLITLLVVIAPGVIWSRRLFPAPTSGADRVVAILTTGPATWIAILFLLSSTHLLRRPMVGALAIAFVLGALRFVRQAGTGERTPWDRGLWLLVLPLIVVLVAVYVIALGPAPGIDAGHYHLTLPRLYAEAGGFRSIPFSVQSNWPLNAELLFAGVLLFADHVSAGLLHFAFGLASSGLIIACCLREERQYGWWAGLIGVAIFWANPIIQYDGGVANNDLAVTFFLLALVITAWRGLEDPRWILLAGISAGMLAGTKINGVFGVVPVAIYVAFRLIRGDSSARLWLLRGALPAFLLAVGWPLKSWVMTGNPVYPFLYDRFGGPDWSSALTLRFQQEMLALGMGRSWKDYLLLPVRVILFGQNDFEHFDGVLTHAWIVLIPAALLVGWRRRFTRYALLTSGLLFVSWATGSQQVRYLIPALAPLALVVGLASVDALGRFHAERRWVMPAAGLGAAVVLLATSGPRLASAQDWGMAYLKEGHRMPDVVIKPVYKFINAKLPADARILLINNNQSFFIHRETIVDSFFLASQVADWLAPAKTPEEVHQRLRAQGVTHLLVSSVSDGTDYPPALIAMLTRRMGMSTVFRDPRNGLELFRLCEADACGPDERP